MKLLFSSHDVGEVGYHVKRLLWAHIPCAVIKDPVTSCLSVWIQKDLDYTGALRLFTQRAAPRPVAHWASALDPSPSPVKISSFVPINATTTGSSKASAPATVPCWDLTDRPSVLGPIGPQLPYFRIDDNPRKRAPKPCHRRG